MKKKITPLEMHVVLPLVINNKVVMLIDGRSIIIPVGKYCDLYSTVLTSRSFDPKKYSLLETDSYICIINRKEVLVRTKVSVQAFINTFSAN